MMVDLQDVRGLGLLIQKFSGTKRVRSNYGALKSAHHVVPRDSWDFARGGVHKCQGSPAGGPFSRPYSSRPGAKDG